MNKEIPDPHFPTVRQAILVMMMTFFVMLLFSGLAAEWDNKYYFIGSRLIFIVPMLLFIFREKFPVAKLLRLRPVSMRVLGISLVIGICLAIIGEEFDRIMTMIIPLPDDVRELLQSSMSADSTLDWFVLIFGVILLTAIMEEWLFRCFLQTILESQLDVTRAVLATAFVFSFFYANPISIVQIVILGVVLGVLAWKSDSFIPSAAAHTMINAVGLMMAGQSLKNLSILNWNGHLHPLLLLLAGVLLYLAILQFYRYTDDESALKTDIDEPV